MANAHTLDGIKTTEHLVLRPIIAVRVFIGLIGCAGVGVSAVCLATPQPGDWIGWASGVAVGLASIALGLAYATTEVHATPTRLWSRRYWFTAWSIPMDRAGTTEGRGPEWNLVHVFDLQTNKRIGAFNWWVLDPKERVRLAEFVDQSREAQGVKF